MFEDTAPLVEGLSIDEAFIDVRGMRRIAGAPVEIAARLRARVADEVGLPITVGVARTKFLAKVASGVAKPDGLLLVEPERELEFLHPFPSNGSGASGSRPPTSCTRAGSSPSARSRRSPELALVGMLGRASGRHLHALAHNRDPRPRRGRRGGEGRSAASARSAGAASPRRRSSWTRCWWG